MAQVLRTSSALQKLKTLRLFFLLYTESIYIESEILPYELIEWEPLIAAITSLPYLEDLELQLPIYVEWCRHFKNYSRLRKITWTSLIAVDDGVCNGMMSSLRHLDPAPLVTFELYE
jgi:hypothetical protein